MSRNEQRIRKACEECGLQVRQIMYEPMHGPYEMEGYCGGWTVLFDNSLDVLGGFSTDEVLANLNDEILAPKVA